jgi:hypothetical protein
MTIHSTGDSHAGTFVNLPGCVVHTVGPVTLKRVGYMEDTLLQDHVRGIGLTPADVLVLCFGEIDCRCFVKPQLEHRTISLEELLRGWVDAYLVRAKTLDTNGARVAILSVTPPCTHDLAYNAQFPVAGTDEERVTYHAAMNALLAQGCAERGLLYVDTYSAYKDENGMLIHALSDNCTHIKENSRVLTILQMMGLLP